MSDPASDVYGMIRAGAWVAAATVPVATVCGIWVRAKSGSLCPRWRLPQFVWPGLAVFALFVLALFAPPFLVPIVDTGGLFQILYPQGFSALPPPATEEDIRGVTGFLKAKWVQTFALPFILAVAVLLRQYAFRAPVDWVRELRNVPRSVAFGTLVFLTFGVAAFAVNAGVDWASRQMGFTPDEHQLSKLGRDGDGFGGVFFVLSACVVAPVIEEFVFRGLLVSWAAGRKYRPWVLVAISAVVAYVFSGQKLPPLALVAILAAAQPLVRWPGKRTGQAIWSSSVLFAAVHSAVWPSPIPLFVLALGLGYLTGRTRSWLPAAVAHGLFNLVSTLFVFSRG